MSVKANIQRIEKEMNDLKTSEHVAVTKAERIENNDLLWKVVFEGPDESPYEDGIFTLKFIFPEDYPTHGPEARFMTPMFHPNVNAKKDNHVCINLLNKWDEGRTLEDVILGIYDILLNPLVKKMTSKGMKRGLAVALAYLIMILVIGVIIGVTIPSLGEQISDIVSAIPKIVEDIKGWIDGIFVKLSNLSLENLDNIKAAFLLKIENLATDIQTDLPTTAVNIIYSLASGIGVILLSLVL